MAKIHFRPYTTKQILLFPQRIDENIAEDAPVRLVNSLIELLAERGFVSLDVEYIDGTKIESKANKYTFVWRKTVEKNRARLLEKIKVLLEQIDDVIAQDNASEQEKVEFTPELLHSMAKELNASLAEKPTPTTKDEKKERKAKEKQVKELQEKADKLEEYDRHLDTLGKRNSYSKTDPDATFMRRKEDPDRCLQGKKLRGVPAQGRMLQG